MSLLSYIYLCYQKENEKRTFCKFLVVCRRIRGSAEQLLIYLSGVFGKNGVFTCLLRLSLLNTKNPFFEMLHPDSLKLFKTIHPSQQLRAHRLRNVINLPRSFPKSFGTDLDRRRFCSDSRLPLPMPLLVH